MNQTPTLDRTTVLPADDAALEAAKSAILAGRTVAIPTETVYGLAADATNGEAVARIFEAKRRPAFNPLICHVTGIEMAENSPRSTICRGLGGTVLARRADPGAAPQDSAQHPPAGDRRSGNRGRARAARFRRQAHRRDRPPLAAPSANPSGQISATTAQAVAEGLEGRVSLVVDGGPAPVGVESTIIKADGETVRLLRPGGLAAEDIEAVLGRPLKRADQRAAIEAPGMLASHYAPHVSVRLNAVSVTPDEALLGFGPERANGADSAKAVLNLSESGDLVEAAANLFEHMRQLDMSGANAIAVEPVPETGLGEAINDRLRRAAAPRGAT
jgi:L-threonylcarbamoyladenylate synthase